MAEIDEIFGEKKETEFEPFSKEDWIKQKSEARTAAFEMLDKATDGLNCVDAICKYLDVQSRFDRYSVSNALLVARQRPEATKLCDANTWKESGAYITKGEKGIIILEPGKEFKREDGSVGVSYNTKKVFDITQTNAKPQKNKAKSLDERLLVKALVKASPVPVEISNLIPEQAGAIYQPDKRRILIRQGMEGTDIFRSLSREIAYARLDKNGADRNSNKLSAQAVAYICCKRAGVKPEPIDADVAAFTAIDAKDKRKELAKIRENANGISGNIKKALEVRTNEAR